MIKYQERFIRMYDVENNVYEKSLKMTERFNIIDRLFRRSLEEIGKKIKRVEWHGDKSYYFDYSETI